VIAEIAEGDKEDVDLAVNAARYAFDHGPWPRMTGFVRFFFNSCFFFIAQLLIFFFFKLLGILILLLLIDVVPWT